MKLLTRIRRYWMKVIRAIYQQSISFLSLLLSITLLAFNTLRPTAIPTGTFSTTGGTGGTISLGTIGIALLLLTIVLGIIGATKK